MAITLDGTTGVTTPGVTDTGNLSVSGTSTLTGAATSSAFIPSGSSIPTNGVFLPSANTLAFATNSTNQVSISSGGIVTGTAGNLMLVQGTAQNTTSGTSIDFTGIPSWAKRITINFSGVSTTGTSSPLIQLGSTSFTTSGYLCSSSTITTAASSQQSTAGFIITGAGVVSGTTISGSIFISLLTGNTWVSSTALALTNAAGTVTGGGNVTLSGTLDRVRITTVGGTDTFDAGSINIQYE